MIARGRWPARENVRRFQSRKNLISKEPRLAKSIEKLPSTCVRDIREKSDSELDLLNGRDRYRNLALAASRVHRVYERVKAA
jgi:hypothetical protein